MVFPSSGSTYYLYVFQTGQILHCPSECLGLVIMLLLIDLDDDVGISLHHCCRQRVHVSDDEVGEPLLSEYGYAMFQKFLERSVAADQEVGCADEITGEFAFRECPVTYYDHIPMHGVR